MGDKEAKIVSKLINGFNLNSIDLMMKFFSEDLIILFSNCSTSPSPSVNKLSTHLGTVPKFYTGLFLSFF